MKFSGLLLAMIGANSPAFACVGLHAVDGWIREPPPHLDVLAAFMTLTNTGLTEIRITKVASPMFAHSMLHETLVRGDQVHMARHDSLSIAAGASLQLKPGGMHVMLMQAREPIAGGQAIPLEITCENGSLNIELIVKRD